MVGKGKIEVSGTLCGNSANARRFLRSFPNDELDLDRKSNLGASLDHFFSGATVAVSAKRLVPID
jgi:hypothetical protein